MNVKVVSAVAGLLAGAAAVGALLPEPYGAILAIVLVLGAIFAGYKLRSRPDERAGSGGDDSTPPPIHVTTEEDSSSWSLGPLKVRHRRVKRNQRVALPQRDSDGQPKIEPAPLADSAASTDSTAGTDSAEPTPEGSDG